MSTEGGSRLEAISTRWTLLRQAQGPSAFTSTEARNALVLRYLPAIRRYVGAIVRDSGAAEDLSQDAVVRLLSGDFAGADPLRGRFRDLLKVALRNMVRNYWSRQKRRRTAAYDLSDFAAGSEAADEATWDAEWRRAILEMTWRALEQHERQQPSSSAFAVLRLRTDYPDESSEQLAARLSAKLGRPIRADALRQKLRRARLLFVDLLLAEVSKAIDHPTPQNIEEELAELGLMDLVRELLPADWKKT